MKVQKPPLAQTPRAAPTSKPAQSPPVPRAAPPELERDRHLARACDAVYMEASAAKAWVTTDEHATNVCFFDHGPTQVLVYERAGHRHVIFRGTLGLRDLGVDLLCVYWATPPRHLGFDVGWRFVKADVERWLGASSTESPIVLAGHSLGGALAVMAAWDLGGTHHRVAEVVTFGCPRVGSGEFAAECHTRIPAIRRYVHAADGITVIPPIGLYFALGTPTPLPAPLLTIPPTPLTPRWSMPSGPATPSVFTQIFQIALQIIAPPIGLAFSQNEDIKDLIDPSRTSLGKRFSASKEAAAGALFWLSVLTMLGSVFLLSHPSAVTGWLDSMLSSHTWLRCFSKAALLILVQQIAFVLAYRCPVWVRLVGSMAAAGAAGMWLTTAQTAAGLLPLSIIGSLVFYRVVSGALDHYMKLYATALGTKAVRQE